MQIFPEKFLLPMMSTDIATNLNFNHDSNLNITKKEL